MSHKSESHRPPLPPFTRETAAQKVRMAEDAWNSRDPARVALAYTPDSRWRNCAESLQGREAIEAFLTRKWKRELDYRLIKELWAFHENRIAARFAYEWHDDSAQWFRSYGNENWEFDEHGPMRVRIASINDMPIKEGDRKYFWPMGRRPDDHPFLIDFAYRRRVKIWAEARVVEGDEALAAQLMPHDYKARAAQVMLFKVIAWDANCPQHIPQRFEAADVASALAEREQRIEALEAEIKKLRDSGMGHV